MALDAEGLREIVRDRLGRGKLVVLSNREPYVHTYDPSGARNGGDRVTWSAPAGGLVTALEPVMRVAGGVWVAHGSGDADRAVVDKHDRVRVPPGAREGYRLRRVWLSEEEQAGYYRGFANQGLWPLCHVAYTRPHFSAADYCTYKEVNRKFARAVLDEIGDDPAWVFVQDYHFALVARMLLDERPDLVVAQFWHIPWPNPEVFAVCPWAEEILDGLLGNDLLGFHLRTHCANFLGSVEHHLEAQTDPVELAVQRGGHRTLVRPFPISVDVDAISRAATSAKVRAMARRLRRQLGLEGQCVAVGVDRLDYTKGIPERLEAVERFLEKHRRYRRRFTYLQVGPESRTEIDEYAQLVEEVDQIAARINARFGADGWQPVRVLKGSYPQDAVLAFYSLADLCIVSSLHDGMNLVAKEFVSARPDGESALVLSRFTGAARELEDAIQINPYDVDGFADAIARAIEMPPDEKRRAMERMREAVAQHTVYDWAAQVVTAMRRIA